MILQPLIHSQYLHGLLVRMTARVKMFYPGPRTKLPTGKNSRFILLLPANVGLSTSQSSAAYVAPYCYGSRCDCQLVTSLKIRYSARWHYSADR
ncbi:hypothetical protein VTN77DRAFT_8754 [Rasamsonia byssochlamydoides]|uniref:uncharacterized protein n=1 Tax=Rasamsonia byssochlamydoides TaxID=89139 RepID=UPI003743C148